MGSIVTDIMAPVHFILNTGASVMMPIIIFILTLIFRMPIGRSIRAALLIGIGFVSINLVIGLLMNTLGPVAQAMVNNLHVHLSVLDVGWPVAAAISFATVQVVPWVFLLGILLNLFLIWIKFTKTLDIDMWNYWHFIFTAAFVYVITNSILVGLLLALLTEVVILKLADLCAPIVQEYYGIPGVSLPHTETTNWTPVTWVLNKIIDKIPGLNAVQSDPGVIQERYGIIGEPMVIGTVLGLLIALLAYAPTFSTNFQSGLTKILQTSITLGAVMLILPRMVAILMEGLVPLSEGARDFLNQRFKGRELWIGMDAAIVVGFPNNITVAIILVPITIVLAVGLSYLGLNHMLPFADLAVLPFVAIWTNTWSRGNILRGLIIGTLIVSVILTIGTYLAPMTTTLAHMANFQIPAGALQISSIDSGSHLLPMILVVPFAFKQLLNYGLPFLIWILAWIIFSVVSYVVYLIRFWSGKRVAGFEASDTKYNHAPEVLGIGAGENAN